MRLRWLPGAASPIERAFPGDALRRIAEAVRTAESGTSGEIRVKILSRCDPDLRRCADPEERLGAQALREFAREGVHATRDRTGVLLLVVLGERRLRILADAGIHPLLPQEWWDLRAERLAGRFREGACAEGVCEAVAEVGRELASRFPAGPGDANELPDEPALGRER